MTWNELNVLCDDMLPDVLGPQWDQFIDDGGDDEKIYKCQALSIIIDTLFDVATDEPENEKRWLDLAAQLKNTYC